MGYIPAINIHTHEVLFSSVVLASLDTFCKMVASGKLKQSVAFSYLIRFCFKKPRLQGYAILIIIHEKYKQNNNTYKNQ